MKIIQLGFLILSLKTFGQEKTCSTQKQDYIHEHPSQIGTFHRLFAVFLKEAISQDATINPLSKDQIYTTFDKIIEGLKSISPQNDQTKADINFYQAFKASIKEITITKNDSSKTDFPYRVTVKLDKARTFKVWYEQTNSTLDVDLKQVLSFDTLYVNASSNDLKERLDFLANNSNTSGLSYLSVPNHLTNIYQRTKTQPSLDDFEKRVGLGIKNTNSPFLHLHPLDPKAIIIHHPERNIGVEDLSFFTWNTSPENECPSYFNSYTLNVRPKNGITNWLSLTDDYADKKTPENIGKSSILLESIESKSEHTSDASPAPEVQVGSKKIDQ